MAREMGGDSGSMGMEAVSSEALGENLIWRGWSSVESRVDDQSETVLRAEEMMRGEIC